MKMAITAQQVQAVADEIAATGATPTIRSIREKLGTGSPNTIQRHLSAWRDARPQVAQVAYEMPADLVNAFGKELRRGAEAATAQIRAELVNAQTESAELASIGEELETEVESLREQVASLTVERDTATVTVAAKDSEISRLIEAVERETANAEAARTEVATARVKIESMVENLGELKAQLAQQTEQASVAAKAVAVAEQAQAVAMAKLDAECEKSKDLRERLNETKKSLDSALKQAQSAHTRIDDATTKLLAESGARAMLERDLERLKSEIQTKATTEIKNTSEKF
jgi:chromosome segregation ATPase